MNLKNIQRLSLSHALTTNMTQTIDCFQIQSTTLCEPYLKYLTSNIGDTEEYVVREEAIWGRSTSKFNPYYLFYLFILSFELENMSLVSECMYV